MMTLGTGLVAVAVLMRFVARSQNVAAFTLAVVGGLMVWVSL